MLQRALCDSRFSIFRHLTSSMCTEADILPSERLSGLMRRYLLENLLERLIQVIKCKNTQQVTHETHDICVMSFIFWLYTFRLNS